MIAKRCQQVQPFYVMDLLAKAKQLQASGRDIIHLEVGEPDFTTPQPIIDAGISALKEGKTHYTAALGLLELRQAVAARYQQTDQLSINAKRVVITPGSSSALHLLMHALVNPGDGVMLTDPGYPCNKHFVTLVGGEVLPINLSAADGFQLNVEQLDEAWKPNAKVLLIASPANPTGTVLSQDRLKQIVLWAKAKSIRLIVDEIYLGLHYDVDAVTALALSDEIIVVNSFSKYFSMTGWRLGWMVVPEGEVEYFDRLAQNLYLCAPTPSQYAALAAFSDDTLAILELRRDTFQRRRDVLLPALKDIGFGVATPPQGAFYIYAESSQFAADSFKWCHALLEQAGVAITPGRDFSSQSAERYVRFAYTTDESRLLEAVDRIHSYQRSR